MNLEHGKKDGLAMVVKNFLVVFVVLILAVSGWSDDIKALGDAFQTTHISAGDGYVQKIVSAPVDTLIEDEDTTIVWGHDTLGTVYDRTFAQYNPLLYLDQPGIVITVRDTINNKTFSIMHVGSDSTRCLLDVKVTIVAQGPPPPPSVEEIE